MIATQENDVLNIKKLRKYKNPFPGLRPFSMDESHLFFGREGQSDEVLKKLSDNKFCAIIGASGSGKSSFIYCGVVPILYGGFLTNIGTNWDVIVTRPGGGPIDNLADAIAKKEQNYESLTEAEKVLKKTIISTLLKSSSLGLTEAVSKYSVSNNTNYLLIVDQFEELFRFKKSEEKEGTSESLAFVNLLVEASQNPHNNLYIAITMRSDFIGDCAQFPTLTKLINQSNYLIPQMTREQKRLAITGPISVGGAKISPRLLQQILSDLGDNPDQLPIMAHSLMRTWDYWESNHEEGEYIDLPHYEAIGTMSGALSQHANEAFDELDQRQKEICAVMFKCLTEKTGDNDGIRRPTKVSVIAKIFGCTPDEVIEIVEVFRRPGRSLLTPPYGITLNANSIIDISHESLMRIWTRLKNWVDEEGQAVDMYLRLSDASSKYQTGKAGLWRPPDLQLALNWQEKNNPTLEWAQRYNPAFERTMVFLETSKKAFETEQKVKEELQRKRLRQTRNVAIALGTLSVLAILALVYSVILKIEADKNEAKALEKEREAIKQSEIARKAAIIAEQQKAIAQEKEREALLQSEEAKHQAELARQAEREALQQKAIAQRSAEIARRQTKLAEEQKALALANEQRAKEQKILADRASNQANKQRFLSIAQAMSVKSLQIVDTTTKALVAQQAYIYNRDYDGNPHNHDIYDGLYYAIKNLYHDNHNILKGHSDAVRGISFAPNKQDMYTVGSDGKIYRWTLKDGRYVGSLLYTNPFVNRGCTVSPNGKYLLVYSEEPYLQLFDITNNNPRPKKIAANKNQIVHAAFLQDNSIVSIGVDSAILIRDLNTDQVKQLGKLKYRAKAMSVDPDGKYVVTGDEMGNIKFWFLDDERGELALPSKNFKKIHAVAVSPNGKYIAAGDEQGNVKLWDIFDGYKLVSNLAGHRARINDIKFDHKSEVLATASFDGTVRLWDLAHLNEQPITLRDHNAWVWSVAFSKDDSHIITGSVDNLIRIYPTTTEAMANMICNKLNRNMTEAEWYSYVAKDVPYEYTCKGLEKGKAVETDK
jgi:WD40 repeat protein